MNSIVTSFSSCIDSFLLMLTDSLIKAPIMVEDNNDKRMCSTVVHSVLDLGHVLISAPAALVSLPFLFPLLLSFAVVKNE